MTQLQETFESSSGVKQLNIGLVGGGEIGKVHAAAYTLLPVYFDPPPAVPVKRVLCDVDDDRAARAAHRYGFSEWVTSYEELVAREDIDIVDITVPNHLHPEVAIAALENGKMVACEKPMAMSVPDARRMYEAAQRASLPTAVTFQKRRHPAVAHAKALISRGAIGRLLSYHGHYRQAFGLLPLPPGNWRGRPDFMGSLLGEVGSHAIDMGRHLVGEFRRVSGLTSAHIEDHPAEIDSVVGFVAEMDGGVIATFDFVGTASSEGDNAGFEIYGTEGAIKWSASHAQVLEVSSEAIPVEERGFTTLRMGAWHPYGEVFGLLSDDGLVDSKTFEVRDMLQAFANGESFSPDFGDGLRVALVVDAVLQSSQSREWIEVAS